MSDVKSSPRVGWVGRTLERNVLLPDARKRVSRVIRGSASKTAGQGALRPPGALSHSSGEVASRDGVRDIRLGLHSEESRSPPTFGGGLPEGRKHAVDEGVLAVALLEGGFPCRVINEREPVVREAFSKGEDSHELGVDLKGVNECPSGRDPVEDGLGRLAVAAVEDVVANPHDVVVGI